jgi:hypothetical protein
MKLQRCVDELLKRGIDDWVQAAEVAFVAQFTGGAVTREEIRQLSLELIHTVVQRGLMKIGDVDQDGFHEWNVPSEKALARVESKWMTVEGGPNLGEICWMSNTEQGDQHAKNLVRT